MKKGNRWDLNSILNSKPHLKALNPQFDKVKESLPLEPENPLKPPVEPVLGHSGGSLSFTIWGDPVPKPRMTQQDKWKKRPCVMRYWAWADKARASLPHGIDLKNVGEISFTAYIGFFKCYSKKLRLELKGKPHRQRGGDCDNFLKSIGDALFEEDCGIWKVSGEKRWDDGRGPRMEVFLS